MTSVARNPLASVLVAVVFLMAGTAQAVHTTTVRHVECEEHGELLDVEGGPEPAPRPGIRGTDEPEEAHHHCLWAGQIPSRAREADAAMTPPALQAPRAAPTSRRQPGAPFAVYRYAPSHSPPR